VASEPGAYDTRARRKVERAPDNADWLVA